MLLGIAEYSLLAGKAFLDKSPPKTNSGKCFLTHRCGLFFFHKFCIFSTQCLVHLQGGTPGAFFTIIMPG